MKEPMSLFNAPSIDKSNAKHKAKQYGKGLMKRVKNYTDREVRRVRNMKPKVKLFKADSIFK